MREALLDLDEALQRAGGRLFLRRGDPVAEALAVARECGAEELHVSADYSAFAAARERRLAAACAEERIGFHAHPGTTIVPPGAVTPGGGDHFKVFTPYHRAWSELPLRRRVGPPRKLTVPSRLSAGRVPALEKLTAAALARGGRAAARREGRRLRPRLPPRRPRRLRRAPRRPSRRRHLAAQRPPALRLRLAAGAGAGSARARAAARPSCASSAGATSTTRCSPPTPPSPAATTARAAIAGRAPAGAGGLAAGPDRLPAWSTRGCASWPRRASCTTGRGWPSPPS